MIERAIYHILDSDASIAALAGENIFANWMPQGVDLPAVVYQQIGGTRRYVMGGPTGMVTSSWQFTCWSDTYAGSRELADAVRVALDSYTGTPGASGTQIINVDILGENDLPVMLAEMQTINRYGKALDAEIWFTE